MAFSFKRISPFIPQKERPIPHRADSISQIEHPTEPMELSNPKFETPHPTQQPPISCPRHSIPRIKPHTQQIREPNHSIERPITQIENATRQIESRIFKLERQIPMIEFTIFNVPVSILRIVNTALWRLSVLRTEAEIASTQAYRPIRHTHSALWGIGVDRLLHRFTAQRSRGNLSA
jgi:hypothetical protein